MIDTLNNEPVATFKTEVERVINVDRTVREVGAVLGVSRRFWRIRSQS